MTEQFPAGKFPVPDCPGEFGSRGVIEIHARTVPFRTALPPMRRPTVRLCLRLAGSAAVRLPFGWLHSGYVDSGLHQLWPARSGCDLRNEAAGCPDSGVLLRVQFAVTAPSFGGRRRPCSLHLLPTLRACAMTAAAAAP
jgi:hypothetical protein